MKFNGVIVLLYGLIVLAGGLFGYLTANSLPSLIAGSIFGALLFGSGLGLFRTSIVAYFTALLSSFILTLFFAFRFYKTGAMTPSGMMAGLSFIIFLLLLSTRGTRKVDSK